MKQHFFRCLLPVVGCLWAWQSYGQVSEPLANLSFFKNPPSNWSVVGSVTGSPDDDNLHGTAGTGVLLNAKPTVLYQASSNLVSNLQHGDIKLSLDFMLPKGSNSGIYLMGRYEIQLFDSWGVKAPKSVDCGSIYERWNEARTPKGYEGHPPLQNACKAPGLWQHLEIDFLAPQFDASGQKTRNARFVKVTLNGVTIHENVEVSGPTRAAAFEDEKAKGPLLIQGDHGAVAFRNIRYESFDKQPVSLSSLTYAYYEGRFANVPATLSGAPVSQGTASKINYRLADKNMDFLIHFSGKLTCPEADTYTFSMPLTGKGKLVIDGQTVIEHDRVYWRNEVLSKSIQLGAGEHTIAVSYTKDFGWGGRALGVFVSRIGMKPIALHEYKSLPNPDPVGEIVVNAEGETTIQRSFVMHQGKKRTHAANVGDPAGVHYTYDLNQGTLLQVWKGDFLNATEMWYERGEPQTSAPLGAVVELPLVCPIAPAATTTDTLNDEKVLLYKGYVLQNGQPTFSYQIGNTSYSDQILPAAEGKALKRTFIFKQTEGSLTARLAAGNQIVALGKGLFGVDGAYYIQLAEGQNGTVTTQNGHQVLTVAVGPADKSLSYQLLW
ncbi:MAG: family 16 glycoside hydrolase [Spirosomataceae bacterium]